MATTLTARSEGNEVVNNSWSWACSCQEEVFVSHIFWQRTQACEQVRARGLFGQQVCEQVNGQPTLRLLGQRACEHVNGRMEHLDL